AGVAAQALINMYVALNSVDYSNRGMSAVLTLEGEALDATVFSATGWKSQIGGLKSFNLALKFRDDFADDDLDEDLFALFNTVVTFAVRPANTTIAAGNPEYQGSVLINKHVLGGEVGQLAVKELEFPGDGAITRDITP